MILKKKFFILTYFATVISLFSCSKDDEEIEQVGSETYSTEVYLTDAPVDNSEVKAVFVTIAEVEVNGKALEGFAKTTIEVSSLTEGKSELLGNIQLEAGTTSNIVLNLDESTDASGNSPGNYVLMADGQKKAIATVTNKISVSDNAEIFSNQENELVLDFDLRKSLLEDGEGNYSFSSGSNLSNNIRVVNAANTGVLAGEISNRSAADAEVVVAYVYEAGAFNESEAQEDSNGLAFSNAVTSTTVGEADGKFAIHYLQEGEYELVFASYDDTDNDGDLELQGELDMSIAGGLTLNEIAVESNSTVNLELAIDGLLNL